MFKDAIFSPCRKYRYTLYRLWDCKRPYAQFIGLNPSTATETEDDPTVRRCINYAKLWGYGGLVMTNIFGYRATDPRDMKAVDEPIGPDNDMWLRTVADAAGIVIGAWGNHGDHLERGKAVDGMIGALNCLKITNDGHPSHPLYLRKDREPVFYPSGKANSRYRMIVEEQLSLFEGI